MRDMYLPRWEAWVDYKLALLRRETAQEADYFQIEKIGQTPILATIVPLPEMRFLLLKKSIKNTSSNYNKPIKTFKYHGSPM